MLKKIVMVFTVALSLLAFCLPVTSSAVELNTVDGFYGYDENGWFIPEKTINGKTFPKAYFPNGFYDTVEYDYFIVKQDTTYYLVVYTGSTAVANPDSNKITVLNTSNGGYYSYFYTYMTENMTSWDELFGRTSWSNQSLPQSINYNSVQDFYITSTNIYDSNDNQVFPQTPWAIAVRELKMVAVPRVLGEMKIVVLCGVGCLALLIGLVVLFKVFQKFQVKS